MKNFKTPNPLAGTEQMNEVQTKPSELLTDGKTSRANLISQHFSRIRYCSTDCEGSWILRPLKDAQSS